MDGRLPREAEVLVFFSYELASKPNPPKTDPKTPDKGGEKKKEKESGPIRTQMVGESPDDDLGYDPKKIPVEDI